MFFVNLNRNFGRILDKTNIIINNKKVVYKRSGPKMSEFLLFYLPSFVIFVLLFTREVVVIMKKKLANLGLMAILILSISSVASASTATNGESHNPCGNHGCEARPY